MPKTNLESVWLRWQSNNTYESQKALSRRSGVSANTINNWLRFPVQHVKKDTLSKLCRALDCQPDELWPDFVKHRWPEMLADDGGEHD